jgi:hypothetical protein
MSRIRIVLLAGAAAIISTSALAADLPPVMYPKAPVVGISAAGICAATSA